MLQKKPCQSLKRFHSLYLVFISCYLGFLAFRSSTVPCNGDDIIVYANIMAVVEKRGGVLVGGVLVGGLAPAKTYCNMPPIKLAKYFRAKTSQI